MAKKTSQSKKNSTPKTRTNKTNGKQPPKGQALGNKQVLDKKQAQQNQNWLERMRSRLKKWLGLCLVLLIVFACTPIMAKVLLYGLNRLPVDVATENTLLRLAPKYIVVLGGGLTEEDNEIVANRYSRLRLQTAMQAQKQLHLPILLSGVESPWMKKWLEAQGASRIYQEDASMNTCENARFTAIKLKNQGINHVVLVTDKYHMARARRQLAAQGIFTTAYPATLYTKPPTWDTPMRNLNHSRRAVYEWVANLRDKYIKQSPKDCRKYPPLEKQKPKGF